MEGPEDREGLTPTKGKDLPQKGIGKFENFRIKKGGDEDNLMFGSSFLLCKICM